MHLNDTKLILNYQKGHSDSFRINLGSGATHKRRQNILGGEGGGSQIPLLQDIRRLKLGKSESKFQHGGGGCQNRPKKSDVFYGRPLIQS